ncbi:MAG: MBL fold metallo-hydrolase [Armatimonadota bacterium]|jgi:glyoxylase-like metal-dependent hydrolase (beta-lactamase superfamily II)
MNVLMMTLGPLGTNCYLVWQEGASAALVIDCAGDALDIVNALDDRELELRLIVNTHGHADHIEALAGLHEVTEAEVAIHEMDAAMLTDAYLSGAAMLGFPQPRVAAGRLLSEDDEIHLEGTDIALTVMHTPGHTPGSICLLGEGVLFSGDTLFAGGIGRVDLPGGDPQAMTASLKRLMELAPEIAVYPGHGETTTIGEEQESNPWLEGM